MSKVFISLLFYTFAISSSTISWSNNYHISRQLAKKQNKNVLLFISSKDNPYCEYMQEDTFKNNKVIKYINRNFIAVRLYVENNNLPKGIKIFSPPSIYFLNPKGKEIYKRVVGEISSKQLKSILLLFNKHKKMFIK